MSCTNKRTEMRVYRNFWNYHVKRQSTEISGKLFGRTEDIITT